SAHTKRSYLSQVKQFLAYIEQFPCDKRNFVLDPSRRDSIAREYSQFLRDSAGSRLSSINTTLTAIDSFYRSLGLPTSTVKRERLLSNTPKVLNLEDKMRLLSCLGVSASVKERAVVLLFLSTGVRIGECVALDIHDVHIADHTGKIFVRNERSGASRYV